MPDKISKSPLFEYENDFHNYEKKLNKLTQLTDLLKRKVSHIENIHSGEKRSKIESRNRLLGDLVWELAVQKSEEGREILEAHDLNEELNVEIEYHEEGYEQLALPGFTPEKETSRKKSQKITARMFRKESAFVKMGPGRRQAELLQELDSKWLNDMHKYMCTGRKGRAGKERLAEELFGWIHEHPLHLLLALDETAVRLLKRVSDRAAGERLIVDEENVDVYQLLAYFGLVELRVVWKDGQLFFGFSVPGEVEDDLLPAWQEIRREDLERDGLWGYLDPESNREHYSVKRLQEELDRLFDRILLMLRYYGIVEAEEFRRLFGGIFQSEISYDQLFRLIYLRGTLHQKIQTGSNRLTGQGFVGEPGLNLDEIFLKREEHCKDIGYSIVTEEELTKAIRETESLWSAVEDFFAVWDSEEGELRGVCCEGNRMVVNGSGLAEVLEYLNEWYIVDNPMDRAMLWQLVAQICLVTPLPVLKGYSRSAFYEAFGKYRYLNLFQETGKKVRKAALHELPLAIQEKLLEIAVASKKEGYFKMISMEEQLPKECMQNEEVKLCLFINRILAYGGIYDPVLKEREKKNLRDRAFVLCEECRDSETTDSILKMCSLNGIVNYWPGEEQRSIRNQYRDEEWDEAYAAPEPVVKPSKVYPNDPCPCGSGKKYKKCCGKK